MMGDRRIALLFWDGYLGVSPSVSACVAALLGEGYGVDLVMGRPPGSFPAACEPALGERRYTVAPSRPNQTTTPWASLDWKGRCRALPRRLALRAYEHADRVRFLRMARRLVASNGYDAVVAVDDEGLCAAWMATAGRRTPIAHWLLEFDPYSRTRDPLRRLIRAVAIRIRSRARIVIVQDATRAEALFGGAPPRGLHVRYVPNSPAGPAVAMRTRFFHERLALPANQRVVLHAGAISPVMLCEELAAAAALWPMDWTLVFHEREFRDPCEALLRRLLILGQGRVALSLQPVPYAEIDGVFGGADVALVLYNPALSPKHRLMAAASGKMAHALRVGVPVVALDSVGVGGLFARYGCGLTATCAAQIGDAVGRILAAPEQFRLGAVACFTNELDFRTRFAAVAHDLDKIISCDGRSSKGAPAGVNL
jgi:hypothetical protein